MKFTLSVLFTVLACTASFAADGANVDDLRKEVDALRKQISGKETVKTPIASADALVGAKYGPNAPVTTRTGKLYIGGALQIWYQAIQNDSDDWTSQRALGEQGGRNSAFDNDSFRLRRIVLRFGMDITENVSSFMLIDTATAPTSCIGYPNNQGLVYTNSHRSAAAMQTGAGIPNLLLLDAKLNYHGVVPHHDFTIGQYKRKIDDEGSRPSDRLDFVDRSMIAQVAHNSYDIGADVHGTWLDDKVQYWFGVQNGPGNIFTVPRFNRTDDNDAKNVYGTLQWRPFWKMENWGGLELIYGIMSGKGGESGGMLPADNPVPGLNRADTSQRVNYLTAGYRPGGPVRGLWLSSEWASFRDRFAPKQVVSGEGVVTANPAQFHVEGWFAALGYRLDQSIFCKDLSSWVKPFEFTARHEVFQNLFYHSLAEPERRLNVFKTTVNTIGVNYNFKGDNAKIMVNYNWVDEEDKSRDDRQVRDVRNDVLAVQFQVAW
ncbi:MAG TPA: hypothetical protein VGP72_13020 [Planctomycetota bacterium]